jgi:hypothetical protein
MEAVARENADAIKVGCGNFVMWLLDGAESYASSFNMVRSKGAQWRRRVRIAVQASGGPLMMCFWQGLLTLVKIKL